MCGIVGIISRNPVADRLVESLQHLEYRGYDSMGIATLVDGKIERRRAEGKLEQLRRLVEESPITGTIGIGHTRWATHGAPIERNAHPHTSHRVAVVHNGIIENFLEIKTRLLALGHMFESDTDTEVIVHLLTHELDQGKTPLEAVQACLNQLHGAFALAILFNDHTNLMVAARRGSPLVIGYGDEEMSIGSDAIALATLTNRVCYLEDGDYAIISHSEAVIYDTDHQVVERPVLKSSVSADQISKGDYTHYMLKEIYEQPAAVAATLSAYTHSIHPRLSMPTLEDIDWSQVDRLTIVACGTSYYAGLVARYWFESLAHLTVDVEIASEFRYRDVPHARNGVAIFISQSGETLDSLCALQLLKERGVRTIALVNVAASSIDRQATHTLLTHAGPEIGVASTKAFSCQLAVLALLSIKVGRARGALTEGQEEDYIRILKHAPQEMIKTLQQDDRIQRIAHDLKDVNHALYLGRGTNFPMALEGALKLKELSYIHAEGYPAGEMKHGPIALIDSSMPVIVLVPHDRWFEKTLSNVQEVLARGAHVICVTDAEGAQALARHSEEMKLLVLPTVDAFSTPLIYAIPMQLLAYHAALIKGTDVDQPRNLAKSVTVE